MNWITYALIAIFFGGLSDVMRKLGSGLKDPIFANFIFQCGTFLMATIMFLATRKVDNNPREMTYAFIGGLLISIFTMFSFRALSAGPGVSTVIPVLRIGVVICVVLFGLTLFRDKITTHLVFGLAFSIMGIYLLFSNK